AQAGAQGREEARGRAPAGRTPGAARRRRDGRRKHPERVGRERRGPASRSSSSYASRSRQTVSGSVRAVPRYSPMRDRRLTAREAATERFAASRVGAWLFLHVFHRIDARLLPLTRGRLSVAVGAPVGMLETVGARTGALRRTPLLYAADGDRLVLIASN